MRDKTKLLLAFVLLSCLIVIDVLIGMAFAAQPTINMVIAPNDAGGEIHLTSIPVGRHAKTSECVGAYVAHSEGEGHHVWGCWRASSGLVAVWWVGTQRWRFYDPATFRGTRMVEVSR